MLVTQVLSSATIIGTAQAVVAVSSAPPLIFVIIVPISEEVFKLRLKTYILHKHTYKQTHIVKYFINALYFNLEYLHYLFLNMK